MNSEINLPYLPEVKCVTAKTKTAPIAYKKFSVQLYTNRLFALHNNMIFPASFHSLNHTDCGFRKHIVFLGRFHGPVCSLMAKPGYWYMGEFRESSEQQPQSRLPGTLETPQLDSISRCSQISEALSESFPPSPEEAPSTQLAGWEQTGRLSRAETWVLCISTYIFPMPGSIRLLLLAAAAWEDDSVYGPKVCAHPARRAKLL